LDGEIIVNILLNLIDENLATIFGKNQEAVCFKLLNNFDLIP